MYIQTYNQQKVKAGIQNLPDSHPVVKIILREIKDKIEKFLKRSAEGGNPRKPDALAYKAIWLNEEEIKLTRKYVNAMGRLTYSFSTSNSWDLERSFIFIRPDKNRAEDIKLAKAEFKKDKAKREKIEKDAKTDKT